MTNRLRFIVSTLAALLAAASPLPAELQPPRPIQVVEPRYPIALIDNPVAGEAMIQLTITAEGDVENVSVVEATRPEFGAAAAEAVRQWHFSPAVEDGKPVPLKTRIPIRFAAQDPEHLLVSFIEKTVGYDVWTDVFEDYEVYAEDNLAKMPRPVVYAPPRYPAALEGTGRVVNMTIQGLVSPRGRFHNPIPLDEANREFLLNAILYLADRSYTAGRNRAGDRVWAMTTFDVRFEPLADSLRRDQQDALEDMQREDKEAAKQFATLYRELLKQFNSNQNRRADGGN